MAMDDINVCVCLSRASDRRSTAEQQADFDRFQALGPKINFEFAEYIDSEEVRAMRGLPEQAHHARDKVQPPSPALRAALAKADVVLGIDLPFDMDVLAPNLKWVQSFAAGVGQLMSSGIEKQGVLVSTGAGLAANPIAEFVIGRILAHWKLFTVFDRQQRDHSWQPAYGRNLAGSTLAVVGFGAIGEAVARRAHALGMHVLATRRNLPEQPVPIVDRFFPTAELKTMLAEADAVVLCAPGSAETHGMFNAETFAAMKKGAYFCNVARGVLVDEPALIEALVSGQLGGAAIDVTVQEPLPADDPLWDAPNLSISPHSAVSLDRYSHDAWALFLENMGRFVDGKPLKNLMPLPKAQ